MGAQIWNDRYHHIEGDVLYFEYANTNNTTWTLTTIYRRKA